MLGLILFRGSYQLAMFEWLPQQRRAQIQQQYGLPLYTHSERKDEVNQVQYQVQKKSIEIQFQSQFQLYRLCSGVSDRFYQFQVVETTGV